MKKLSEGVRILIGALVFIIVSIILSKKYDLVTTFGGGVLAGAVVIVLLDLF